MARTQHEGEEKLIQFAIPVPKELELEVIRAFTFNDPQNSIDTMSLPLEQSGEKDLGFDPMTEISAVWVGVKVVGPTAASLVVGVISGLIANEIFRRRYSEAKGHTLTIRLPDATTIEVPLDKPLDEVEVRMLLLNSEKDR
jgi:hypothetical protein